MQMKKIMGAMALTTVLAIGITTPSFAEEVTAEAAQQAITDAEAAREKAAAANGEWRDTAKLISEAQEALKAGDPGAAMSKAKKAKAQGELGLAQAESQKAPDSSNFLK